jgi:predicted nucleotide-binding protein (sugar kinase/HSP70/actin superfamily)
VPAILREQGVLPIPVDCFPVDGGAPALDGLYWGYGQQNLRAAEAVRGTPGVYSVFCSNYSCGPDSFTGHFFAEAMRGKPFAAIETDGHSGDAGTKTRIEAFLYCVREDRARTAVESPRRAPVAASPCPGPAAVSLHEIAARRWRMRDLKERGTVLLLPRLSEAAAVAAAALRGVGLNAEALPFADPGALARGRRHTSGKECIPLCLTLGSVLRRVEDGPPDRRYAVLMPASSGPCRFGLYQLLQKVIVERLGLGGRIGFWSPSDEDYFEETGGGFAALAFSGFVTQDILADMLLGARPVERSPGLAARLHGQYAAELVDLVERRAARGISVGDAVLESFGGRLFGCADLLRRAAGEFAAAAAREPRPVVLVAGEIYVRADPFANGFVVRRLEERGLSVRIAPMTEWFEYVSDLNLLAAGWRDAGALLSNRVQHAVLARAHRIAAAALGWPARTTARQALDSARPLLRPELTGEACLTLGAPLHEWRRGVIDGVVNVGPLECMPSKLAEAQFFHAAEQDGVLALTLSMNGDPIDPDVLDRFAYDVHARFRAKRHAGAALHTLPLPAGRARTPVARRPVPELP